MTRELRAHVAVVGAGPAGITAAVEAARAGQRVVLVSDGPVGGRAMHASLLPSKVLIHLAEQRRARGEKGLARPEVIADLTASIARIAEHQRARAAERLEDGGVEHLSGAARFAGPRELEIERDGSVVARVVFERAIVASGSVPTFPPGFFGDEPGPDGEIVFAPRFVSRMRSLSETMLVVGGGVTGTEMVCALQFLGVSVTWLLDDLGILPGFDRQLAGSLGDVLMERGVKIVHGKRVLSVLRDRTARTPAESVLAKLDGGRTYAAERAFIAIGRRPDVARLRPEQAGLPLDATTGALVVDALGRTPVSGIYAVGDAAGPPYTVTKARAQAYAAARHATGSPVEPPRRDAWIEAVYTQPELARVGLTPGEAARRGSPFELRVLGYDSSLRGVLEGAGIDPHARGVIEVVLAEDGTVEGATAIGPHAAEVLAPLATAIHLGARLEALRGLFLGEPTLTALAIDALR